MNVAARAATPVLRNAAGEPPLGIGGLAFRDDQGEMFQHDNPRYQTPAARIGVLELEDGRWLAHPPGFRIDAETFGSREAALDVAIEMMLDRAHTYASNAEGEGTHWTEDFSRHVIAWAESLRPEVRQGKTGASVAGPQPSINGSENGVATVGAPAAPRPLLQRESNGERANDRMWGDLPGSGVVIDNEEASSSWQHAGNDAEQLTSDPIVNELVEAFRKRKQFPAKHIFSMTTEVVAGRAFNVGTCACGHVVKYIGGDYLKMDAAIEAHWRRFYHEPSVDGRGVPIKPGDAARISSIKKPRSRKQNDSDIADGSPHLRSAGDATASRQGPAQAPPDGAGPLYSDDDAGRRAALAAIAAGQEVDGQMVRNLIGEGYLHATTTRLVVTDEGQAFLQQGAPIGAASIADEKCKACEPVEISTGSDEMDRGNEKAENSAEVVTSGKRPEGRPVDPEAGAVSHAGEGESPAAGVIPDAEAALTGAASDDLDDDDLDGALAIEWPSYDAFLEGKIVTAPLRGIEVERAALHPWLKPHCKDLVVWALRLGCAAIFASFGLHKTAMQLEWCRQLQRRCGGATLNVVPLGVRHGFISEAVKLDMDVRFIRTNEEFRALSAEGVVHFLTNYESIREGKLHPNLFAACSLDEASVLRSYGSKTFQEFLPLFSKVMFKLVATATPSPNRYKELIHYSGFLGVMDTGLALTRFFQRNSEKAGDLTLYPHKETEFWMWIHSWAAFLQKPSELGYSDEGYELPPLKLRWHEVPADHSKAQPERDGQGVMFRNVASSLSEAAKSRRDSLASRIAKMSEIIAVDPDAHRIIWHDLEAEREAIEDALPTVEYGHWGEYRDGNPYARALYERHYSARPDRDSALILGPGEKMLLLNADKTALFGWRKFKDDSGQRGVNAAVFRSENGDLLSSDLIKEAMAIAWLRWPGERFYTFVDAEAVASDNPGYCFLMAGWKRCGKTQGGLDILEALPGCEVPAVEPRTALSTITGTNMTIDEREIRLHEFEEGRIKYFGTKPVLSGSGSNFQYHCHKAIYVSLPGFGYKFNDFIQSLYRLQRFGQQHPVEVDIIYSEDERAGRAALEEKWALDTEMRRRMSAIIAAHGLNTLPLRDALARTIGVKRVEVRGQHFIAINNDCVAECRTWPDNSVDQIITSIPFSNHYEYSASYRDFGHTDDNGHFWGQMDFLTTELLRMLKPGRLACIHVKDRVLFGSVTGEGVSTISPFHAEAIMHYRAHGFQYMGMIHIDTDVVKENADGSYRLGWSENCKDSTTKGVGSPEYVLLLRKRQSDRTRGYADVPVVKEKWDGEGLPAAEMPNGGYSRARWQIDAHAFWRSSGNRLLTADEFAGLPADTLRKIFAKVSAERIYDYEAHVQIGERLERAIQLPAQWSCLSPGSTCENTWYDVIRMHTLNSKQVQQGREKHICPLQFDIVDRLINRYSNLGDLILDPFGGIGTVPYRAMLKKRRGVLIELSSTYFLDAVDHCRAAESKMDVPALFDLVEFDAANAPPPSGN